MDYDKYKLSTPPENTEEQEKERCTRCNEPFEKDDLFLLTPNQRWDSPKYCSFCLSDVHGIM